MSQHPISINPQNFTLNFSGVAGFFGGDEAVQAMKTIHLYKARRWTGWYNAPGSFTIAKCLGPIANSRFWNALFPGPNENPETAFGLDNQPGPKYIASQSGTIIDKTTHVAYLVTQKSKEKTQGVKMVKGRKTQPMTLTVVEVMGTSPMQSPAQEEPTVTVDVKDHKKWLAGIPIFISLGACALCGYNRDGYCLAMIFLGIMSNGLTCLVVGSASVVLKGVKPAPDVPPGDGILVDDSSNHIVILKGEEKNVNWVTKGRFQLEYLPRVWMKKRHKKTGPSPGAPTALHANSDPEEVLEEEGHEEAPGPEEYRGIGLCGFLLNMQTLLQLLLIPQGTLSGQIAFLFSFVISWLYNLYLSSLDKEKIQQELLFKTLNVKCTTKFQLGTRTTAAVFATLVLRPFSPIELQPFSPILGYFLPNETVVWKRWREHVGKHIETINWTRDTDKEVVDASGRSYKEYDAILAGLSVKDERLLRKLLDDAWDGFEGYCTFLNLKHPDKLV